MVATLLKLQYNLVVFIVFEFEKEHFIKAKESLTELNEVRVLDEQTRDFLT